MDAADNSHHLKLELDGDPDVIHGTIERGDGTRAQFWGWLELLAALERATAASATPPDQCSRHGRTIGDAACRPITAR